jgi:hypothetical protein
MIESRRPQLCVHVLDIDIMTEQIEETVVTES